VSSARELLTARELQVLILTADGLSGREIADRLRLGTATVKTHRDRINHKLNARNGTHAVSLAYVLGLIAPAAPAVPQTSDYTAEPEQATLAP
jgi:DNA-binding CsgD family transcriptional regulator